MITAIPQYSALNTFQISQLYNSNCLFQSSTSPIREIFTLKRRRFRIQSSSLVLPLLPFPSDQVLVPSEAKRLHLYEARYLALLEESLFKKKKLFVHFVLDPVMLSDTSEEASFAARYGCLVKIEKVEQLEVGALVSIRGVGRVKIQKFEQEEPYLTGVVIPQQDDVSSEVNSKVLELKEALHSLNRLEIKLKVPQEALMQTQTANSLIWAETALDLDCDDAFIPSVAERVSFSALQPVSVIMQRCKFDPVRPLISFSKGKTNKFQVFCSQVKVEESLSDEACELVNGTELTIGEGDESTSANLFQAVKNNNSTGILLLSDIYGFDDSSTKDFAYRVACNGYNVLVPDLFQGNPWTKDQPTSCIEQWIAKQNRQRIANDIFASAKWMMNEFSALGISKKLGVVGFCFGGSLVLDILRQDQGTCFGAAVSFYGTRIESSVASNIKVPLLLIAGDSDPLCPINALEDIEKRNKESKMVVFRGRGHGFAHKPQTPEEDEDAEEAFKIMRNWLHDGLLVQN